MKVRTILSVSKLFLNFVFPGSFRYGSVPSRGTSDCHGWSPRRSHENEFDKDTLITSRAEIYGN
jgi:hypothetical protein